MRVILYAILINALFLVALECGYRYTGGVPAVKPGKTNLEFQWKVRNTHTESVIYVIGDSRVDWGLPIDYLLNGFINCLAIKYRP